MKPGKDEQSSSEDERLSPLEQMLGEKANKRPQKDQDKDKGKDKHASNNSVGAISLTSNNTLPAHVGQLINEAKTALEGFKNAETMAAINTEALSSITGRLQTKRRNLSKKPGTPGTDESLDAINEERGKTNAITELLGSQTTMDRKVNRVNANKVIEKFHGVLTCGVKNTDLPPCLGVCKLKAEGVVFSCDLKFSDAISLAGYDSVRAAAPAVGLKLDEETQVALCDHALVEFARHSSQKKTESEIFKGKLAELLRLVLHKATCAAMIQIAQAVITVLHPRASKHSEVGTALAYVVKEKERFAFVRSLMNLPPSEQWFVDARQYANEGAKMTAVSERYTAFASRDEFQVIVKSLQEDPKAGAASQHGKLSELMADFTAMQKEIPDQDVMNSDHTRNAITSLFKFLVKDIVIPMLGGISEMWTAMSSSVCRAVQDAPAPAEGSPFLMPSPALDQLQRFGQTYQAPISTLYSVCACLDDSASVLRMTLEGGFTIGDVVRYRRATSYIVSVVDLALFLEDGKLNPTEGRADRAIALLAPVMQNNTVLSCIHAQVGADPDGAQPGMYDFLSLAQEKFEPWIVAMATELEDPMQSHFFERIFTHKFFQV